MKLFAVIVMLISLSGPTVQAQNLLWAKRAGSGGTPSIPQDVGQAIAVDSLGNSYVTGQFRNTATFGPGETNVTVMMATGQDIFVAKYNTSGALQWAKRIGTVEGQGNGIGVDAAGNSYVTGFFNSSATFAPGEAGAVTLTAAGVKEIFLAKYDTNGNFIWAKQAGSTFTDQAEAIAVDASGNSYVTGRFGDVARFGSGEVNQTDLTAPGLAEDIFIAKYDSNGLLQWAKRAGGTSTDHGLGIAIDGAGNSYVTGIFSLTATFGPNEGNVTLLTAPLGGNTDIFVAKYNTNGALQWAKRAGGPEHDRGVAIAVDSTGNPYVTGTIRGRAFFAPGEGNETFIDSSGLGEEVFLAKYNTNGALQWVIPAGQGFGEGIALDAAGNSYITGYSSVDIFVARYGTNGLLHWSTGAGAGSGSDRGFGIRLDGSRNVLVTGQFAATVIFGQGEANQTTLISAGAADIFIAKFANCQPAVDFDGDCKSDVAVYRNGLWIILRSSDGGVTATQFGGGTDVPLPADYDGDGKTDIAVYRSGLWIYSPSSGGANVAVQFGGGTDEPLPADYDGDGKTDVAVYRNGLWIYKPSSGGANVAVQFGGGTDVPVPADYDGDGKTDVAVYRSGLWIYSPSSGGANVALQFGGGTDVPIPADYDGDGKTDVAVYRSGLWIYSPSSGGANVAVQFGGGTDIPMPADYDGDGKTDIAVYRNGLWIILRSTDGGVTATQFGGGTDVPLN